MSRLVELLAAFMHRFLLLKELHDERNLYHQLITTCWSDIANLVNHAASTADRSLAQALCKVSSSIEVRYSNVLTHIHAGSFLICFF